jgi:hypothetical protein
MKLWRKKYPVRSWPVRTPDGMVYDYEIKIDGKWLEVVTENDKWDEIQAEDALQRYLKQKTKDKK